MAKPIPAFAAWLSTQPLPQTESEWDEFRLVAYVYFVASKGGKAFVNTGTLLQRLSLKHLTIAQVENALQRAGITFEEGISNVGTLSRAVVLPTTKNEPAPQPAAAGGGWRSASGEWRVANGESASPILNPQPLSVEPTGSQPTTGSDCPQSMSDEEAARIVGLAPPLPKSDPEEGEAARRAASREASRREVAAALAARK